MAQEVLYSEVICIGAGFSGLCVGAQLQTMGVENFRIYERESSLGGTWFVNTYPGCMCDVPAVVYSFSFAPNDNWSSVYCSHTEILAYMKNVSHKFDLDRRTTLRTEVIDAIWDDIKKRWRVTLRDTVSGKQFQHECKLLFTGVGQFGRPRTVEDLRAEDHEKFTGTIVRSTKWDPNITLKNKRVVLIGNGCTGNQILPAIADEVESVVQLVRSRHWIVEDERTGIEGAFGFFGRNMPFMAPAFRQFLVAFLERQWLGYMTDGFSTFVRGTHERAARAYIKKNAPPQYQELLIPGPDVPFNCKRRIMDEKGRYLGSLHKSNVLLREEYVVKFTENAVVTDKGTAYPADVVILATGFYTNNGGVLQSGIKIHGRNGVSLQDHWSTHGGAVAYDTVASAGFPNLFFVLGPNSFTGHTSCILTIENAVQLALKVALPVLKGERNTVEITQEAEQSYQAELQSRMDHSIWSGSCTSWYTTGGHNSTTYPWSQAHLWWRAKHPTTRDWALA